MNFCSNKSCQHGKDVHAGGNGYCGICSCQFYYVDVDSIVIQDTCQHCGHLWKEHNYTGCLRFTITDDLCGCKLTPDDSIKDRELFRSSNVIKLSEGNPVKRCIHCSQDIPINIPMEAHLLLCPAIEIGPTIVNDQGGKQSRLDMAFNEIEPMMLQRVARVLDQGTVKYGSKNWRQIPYEDHINHMQYHAIMANTDDTSEDHLANVICRAMFAMYMKRSGLQ